MLSLLVVKGIGDISGVLPVNLERRVVFPTFGKPTIEIVNIFVLITGISLRYFFTFSNRIKFLETLLTTESLRAKNCLLIGLISLNDFSFLIFAADSLSSLFTVAETHCTAPRDFLTSSISKCSVSIS